MKKEEFANTMMVNTSIDSGAAPVSYVNEEYLVARDRSDGMSSIVYRRSGGGGGKYEKASVLKGHEMIVKSLANDGADTVVSGGWDGRVLAWKVGRSVGGQGCQIQKSAQITAGIHAGNPLGIKNLDIQFSLLHVLTTLFWHF